MKEVKDFRVGMAKADVTPELDCILYGYPWERYGKKIRDRLSVGVLAISQNSQTVLLISAEVCALNREKCDEIRNLIGEATGVKKDNILYATTHTHSGPVTRTSAGWGETDQDYMGQKLIPASIEAARRALDNMQPAMMGIGTTESKAGINRRQLSEEGTVGLGQNPDGPYDPTMTVISFKSTAGENIGSIVHFATHPTATEWNFSITRDWPGVMVDRMEEITEADCIFINGAEGDVGPRLRNGRSTGDERHLWQIGNIAADDAERAYRSIETFEVPTLSVEYGNILFPFSEPPAREEVEQKIIEMESREKLWGSDVPLYNKLKKLKEIYDSGQPFPTGMEVQQTVVALGELALVPFAFEAFCNIALSLREKSPYQYTLLLGLTGGSYGYLPTEEQIPYGGYEVDSFRAAGGLAVSFVDHTDKLVVDQNVELLQKMCNVKETK